MKNQNFYQQSIRVAPFGYACYQIIRDDPGNPCNFKAIGLNDAFERLTGHNKEDILGNTLRVAFPDPETSFSGLRSLFDKVAAENAPAGMEYYFAETGRWLLVNAWHTDPSHIAVTLNDITAGRQSIEAGCLKEVQQHAFWDNNLFGVMIADKNGNYVDANDEVCRMTGYSCEELKSMNVLSLIDREKIEDARIHFEQILKTGRAYGELAYFSKNGEKRWWNVMATRLSDDFFVGLHQDITGRKLAEEQLHQEKTHHEEVISNISDVLWEYEVDPEGNFVKSYISPVADILLGLPAGTIGQSFEEFFKFIHPEDFRRVQDTLNASILSDEQRIHRIEYRAFTSDGIIKHLHSSGIVYKKPNGNRLAYGTTSDISALKKKEEELLKAKANLTAIVENTLDSIWVINSNYEILYLNEKFRQAYLAAFNVLLEEGSNKLQSMPEKLIPLWKKRYDKVLAGQRIEFVDTVEVSGMTVYLEVAGNPVIQNGSVIGASFFGRDITGRRQAESELFESKQKAVENEALFRAIFQQAAVGVAQIESRTGKFLRINKTYCSITGYDESEMLTIDFQSITHPDDLKSDLDHMNLLLKGEIRSFSIEKRYIRKNGEIVWVELTVSPMWKPGEEPNTHIAVVQSITERKQAEEDLKENELKFRTLYENSGDAIFIMKGDTFIDCNLRTLEVYGCQTRDQILGHTPFEFSPAVQPDGRDSRDYALEIIAAANTGQTQFFEWAHTKLDGTPFTAEVKLNKLELNGQKLLQAIVRDVRERKQAEAELLKTQNILAEKEAQYRIIAENSTDLIYVYSLIPEPHYEYISPSCLQLTGYRPDEGYADPFIYHKFMNNPAGLDKLTQFLMDPAQPGTIEEEWIKKDGTQIWVEQVVSRNFDANGNLISFQSTVRDITERNRSEEVIRTERMRLAGIIEGTNAGTWEWNVKTGELILNERWAEIIGYSLEELSPVSFETWTQHAHPDDLKQSNELLGKHFSGELDYYEFESRMLHKNGAWVWVLDRGKVTTWSHDGKPLMMFGTHQDITKRMQAVDELKASERKFRELSTLMRLMTDNMPDMLWAKNLNKEYIFANKAICNNLLSAVNTEEPLGKTDMFFATRERNSQPDNPLWHTFGEICRDSDSITLEELKPTQFDEFGNVKGKFLFLDVHKAPLCDDNGELIGIVGSARDVTAAKETENQLRKLSQAVEQSPAIIIITDPEGKIEYVNPKFCEITGFTSEESKGHNYNAFRTDEMPESVVKELWKTINAGSEWKGEFHNKKKNGELYWESVSISPIYNNQGTITNFLAVKEDITQRKSTDLEVERNRAELKAIYENAPVMMAVIDQNRNLLFANPAFTNFTGVPEAELIGGRACGVFGCINAFDNPQGCGFGSQCKACMLLKSIEDSFLTGKTHKDIEYNTTLKCNNTLKEISLIGSTAPINFAGKSLLLLSFVDISDRKHTESQLRKLSQAVEQSPASVVITNLDGTIEYVNPKFTEITGYTPEEAIGQKMSLLKSGKLPDPVYAKLWKTISSGRNWKGELHNKKKNGEYFWEFALISPIKNEKGEISHYLAVKEDITERKALEERLKLQTKLRELLMEISSGFINIPLEKVEESVNEALSKMGQFVNADRAYTFDYDWEKEVCRNTYEWCNEGISAQIQHLQNIPLTVMIEAVEEHKMGHIVCIPDVIAMPEGAAKELIESQGVLSFIMVPMMSSDQCIGFVGFDSVREHHDYSQTEMHLLRLFAQSLTNVKLRQAMEGQLTHQTRLRELLMEISSGFINIPLEKVEESVNDALSKMAIFVNADRSYTFDYDWENDICNNIFEWCEEGISAEINNLQQVPLAMMQDWVEAHKKGEPMYVPDVFALPHGAVRDILEPQGIKSVLSVPMMNENQCIGFVGFDSVREHHEYTSTEVHLLRVFAQSLANIKLRKEMVEQLLNAKALAEESEEKHRILIEQMLEGLVVDDGNGIILFANPMFCKMTGYSENELLGKSAYELLLQKHDIEKVRMKDEERKRNITDQYELDVITKSGEVHTFYFHATPVLDKKGNVTASMSTVTDITERKRDQEKIRITRDTYENIFNSVSEAIYVLDENGYFIDVNRGAEIMYGFNREELIGKSPAEITAPGLNDLDLVMKTIQEVRKTGISRSFEFWGQRKNSEIFPKDVSLNRGKYFGKDHIIATARDITERKRGDTARIIQYNIARSIHTSKNAADLLETIRQELGQLFDTTNFFVARYNPEKDTLRQLIFCDEMDSFDEWDANQSISGQVVKSGKTIFLRGDEVNNFSMHHNLEMLGTDSACWLGVPVVMHNRPGGVMVIQHYTNPDAYSTADVALFEMIAHETGIFLEKQIMIEDLISAKEKAEESNRLKTAFMDNISHEVRTPLNGILGFGDVLMDETTDLKDKLEYYQFIKHSSERLMQTIADIMNISQLKAGTLKPNITDVQVKQVMHQCFEKTKTACATKNILVKMDLPEDLENLHLMTDQEIFELTMNHLLSNAEKFTQQGRITFGVNRDGEYARFYVKDTGQGIAPEKLEVIFEPFMQEDNSTTRGHEGSGLGLAIARGMAELLGGKIWVESEKNVGSVFYFTLPLHNGTTKTETALPSAVKTPSANPLILIAEDDQTNYLLLKTVLNKNGYNTLHAFNGEEAVNICRNYPEITLILMDIKMPVMNGIEAMKKIREFRPDMPVIAITAHTQTGDKHRFLTEGCNDYISKPMNLSDLKAIIIKWAG